MNRLSSAATTLLGEPETWVTTASVRPTKKVASPLSGDTNLTVPVCDPADIELAASRARAAQKRWAETPVRDRAKNIKDFSTLVWTYEKELLDLVQGENGKARSHAFEELSDVAMTASYYAKNAAKFLESRRVPGVLPVLTRTTVHHHPRGVVGVISPWNYPLTLAVSDAVPALLAGNAIVLKPDSQTPLCALAAKKILVEAGLDPDLFQVVTGPGSAVGSTLIENSDYLMFTGSTKVGRDLATQAGKRLIPFSAELGGKNPLIVLEDAPLARAVKSAVKSVTSNSGQLCISIERIYVEDKIWDRFVPAFVRAMKKVKVGAGYSWKEGMGPLISESQLATIQSHVDDAVEKGATVLAGGRLLPKVSATAYAPTVLTGITENMLVAKEETFGPVVSLYRVNDAEAAIELANDTEYGLNASLWTSTGRGARLAKRIKAGTVNVNDGYIAAWASISAPMGGMKASGVGRRHGSEGILKYTEAQTVATSLIHPIQAPGPIGEKTWSTIMKTFIKLGK